MREMETLLLFMTFLIYVGATLLFSLRYWLRTNRLIAAGIGFSGAGLAIHTGLLIQRSLAAGRLPLSNLYEFTLVFAWITMLTFVYCARRYRMLAVSPMALALTTILLGIAAMMPRDIRPLMPALRSVWLQAHVLTGILSYGALAVSAVLALVYLAGMDEKNVEMQPHEKDESSWAANYWRMPSRIEVERYIHGLIIFGFVFLSLLIVTGAVWAEETWGRWWGWDPKEAWALATWLIYLVYLHGRTRFGWQGKTTAWFSAVGFLAVMFTLFGVTYLLPGLHSYK